MKRPKINLKRTTKDNLLITITLLAVILSFVLIIMHYFDLPNDIARHFDGQGNPNIIGSKTSIVALPIVSLIITTFMLLLCKIPQSFNYLTEITPDNAKFQYSLAILMMRLLAMITALMSLHLTYEIIEVGLGNKEKLASFFLSIWMSLIGIVIIWYFIKASKN